MLSVTKKSENNLERYLEDKKKKSKKSKAAEIKKGSNEVRNLLSVVSSFIQA